jgi:hypothetical protein
MSVSKQIKDARTLKRLQELKQALVSGDVSPQHVDGILRAMERIDKRIDELSTEFDEQSHNGG